LSALDLDGGTDIGADLVDADLILVDDGAGGTNRKSALSRMKKYIYSSISGDATASDAGVLTIANSAIETAMVNANVITGQTAENTIADDDLVLIYDASESALRKMTKANFVSGLSGGGGEFTYSAITSTTTAQASYHYSVNTSGSAVTLNLPARSGVSAGKEIRVKLATAGNDLTIDANGSETIDGSATLVLNVANQSVTLVAGSSTNWEII